MRAVLIAAASAMVMLAGGLVWNANASPVGAPSLPNYSPVEKVGCNGAGRCPWDLIGFAVLTDITADVSPALRM
jgi:hypothetical protein